MFKSIKTFVRQSFFRFGEQTNKEEQATRSVDKPQTNIPKPKRIFSL